MKEGNKLKSLLKSFSLLVVLDLVIGSGTAFSATCPVLVSEIKTGKPYGIILKDTQSRGLSGTVTKVDTSKCLVTVKYAEEKFAIVDGNYILAILENP
jgi:hypothetical protein